MPGEKRKREKKTEQFWRRAVAQQQQRGVSQSAYCKEHGLSATSFSHWKLKLQKLGNNNDTVSGAAEQEHTELATGIFVPIAQAVTPTQQRSAGRPVAELDLSLGLLRLFSGIDRYTLHEIVTTLREVTF